MYNRLAEEVAFFCIVSIQYQKIPICYSWWHCIKGLVNVDVKVFLSFVYFSMYLAASIRPLSSPRDTCGGRDFLIFDYCGNKKIRAKDSFLSSIRSKLMFVVFP